MTSVDQINRRLNKAVMTTFYGPEPRGEVECLRCGGTFSVGVRGNCTKAALQHARTEHAKEAAEAEAKVKQQQGVVAVTRGAKAQATEKSALTTSSETGEKGTGSEPRKDFPEIDIDEDDDEEDAPMPLAQPDGMGNYALERNRDAARDALYKANEDLDELKRKLQEAKAVKRKREAEDAAAEQAAAAKTKAETAAAAQTARYETAAADKICALIDQCLERVPSTSTIERKGIIAKVVEKLTGKSADALSSSKVSNADAATETDKNLGGNDVSSSQVNTVHAATQTDKTLGAVSSSQVYNAGAVTQTIGNLGGHAVSQEHQHAMVDFNKGMLKGRDWMMSVEVSSVQRFPDSTTRLSTYSWQVKW